MDSTRKKNTIKLRFSRTFYLTIVFALLFLFPPLNAWSNYAERDAKSFFSVDAEGFVIRKNEKGLVKAYMVQPMANLTIKEKSGRTETVLVKIDNISPAKYSVEAEGGKITERGTRHLVYEIKLSAGASVTVKVTPRLKNPDEFTFAVLGDSRHGTKIHQKILREIDKTEAIFAINLGDIVNNGTKAEYESYIREIADFTLPYFVAIGNHEVVHHRGAELFKLYVNPLNYDFSLGKFNFIIMDNSRKRLSEEQFQKLTGILSSGPNNFVFKHMPAFSPWEIHKNHGMHKDDSARFMKLMEKYKVHAAFAGHIHGYNMTEKNGTKYVIAGCAGAYPYVPPQDGGFYHYILVHVNGDKVNMQMFRVNP